MLQVVFWTMRSAICLNPMKFERQQPDVIKCEALRLGRRNTTTQDTSMVISNGSEKLLF